MVVALNLAIEAKMSLDFMGGFKCSSYIPIPVFWIDKAQPENSKILAVDTTHEHSSAFSGRNSLAKSRFSLNITTQEQLLLAVVLFKVETRKYEAIATCTNLTSPSVGCIVLSMVHP